MTQGDLGKWGGWKEGCEWDFPPDAFNIGLAFYCVRVLQQQNDTAHITKNVVLWHTDSSVAQEDNGFYLILHVLQNILTFILMWVETEPQREEVGECCPQPQPKELRLEAGVGKILFCMFCFLSLNNQLK